MKKTKGLIQEQIELSDNQSILFIAPFYIISILYLIIKNI